MLYFQVSSFAIEAAYATDFGVIGQTFKIEEESFIMMLKKRLDNIDYEQEKQKIRLKAKDQIENPLPVSGIESATEDRVFYFDPSYTLDKDVVLPCGKILHKAGTKVNPLEHEDLNRRLFFIDGRQEAQVLWLKEILDGRLLAQEKKEQDEKARGREQKHQSAQSDKKNQGDLKVRIETKIDPKMVLVEDRVILVGGSVFKLKEILGESHADKVYFDQAGELTTKFGIRVVPAVVEQEGLVLRLKEIKLE